MTAVFGVELLDGSGIAVDGVDVAGAPSPLSIWMGSAPFGRA